VTFLYVNSKKPLLLCLVNLTYLLHRASVEICCLCPAFSSVRQSKHRQNGNIQMICHSVFCFSSYFVMVGVICC
jgi:hypothetical protein